MSDRNKIGLTELPLNEAKGICADEICGNYTVALRSLQEEISLKFSPKRDQSIVLGSVYSLMELDRRSDRVFSCGTYLEFKVTEERSKLQHSNFCKDRLCPMCNWRRSLKIFSQVSRIMDNLDGYEFLFLTLTVKNCSAEDLPITVQALFDGWRYLYNKNKEFRSVIFGTFRSLEVTRNKIDGSFHPHLHCILAVKPSYFKKGYITQKRWSELWQSACGLDYNPIVHVQKVKDTGKGIAGAVAEATKYSVKGTDFLSADDLDQSASFVQAFLSALSYRRLCGWTGVFASVRRQLNLDDAESGDLVNVDGDLIREDVACMIVRYSWRAGAYSRIEI